MGSNKSDEKLYAEFNEKVKLAIEMYPHGNDGTEAICDLYQFWIENQDRIKWSFWAGPGEHPASIITCYREQEPPSWLQSVSE